MTLVSKATAIIMLALMNAARGDAALELSDDLTQRAEKRAAILCSQPLSHAGWEAAFAGTSYSVMAENLAKGHADARAAYEALMTSPGHRANILNPEFRHVGIGEACGVIVQLFSD